MIKFWYDDDEVENFYASHPMLRAMEKARSNGATSQPNDPFPQLRDVLLQRVPVGSNRDDAIRILASEGLICEKPDGPSGTTRLSCLTDTRPASVSRWYIELHFDQDDKMIDCRAFPFKATAT